MPEISHKLADFLIKATMAKDVRDAFDTVFGEYLKLKLMQLDETDSAFRQKWKMTFEEFGRRIKDGSLEKDPYSFDVEQDFWKWEEAVTLKQHYEEMIHMDCV